MIAKAVSTAMATLKLTTNITAVKQVAPDFQNVSIMPEEKEYEKTTSSNKRKQHQAIRENNIKQ